MRANYGKYHDGLDADEIALVEARCRREMLAFGYRPESDDGRPLAQLEALLEPVERWEKPEYAEVDVRERAIRSQRTRVLERIRERTEALV
jgi:hypothetical protein